MRRHLILAAALSAACFTATASPLASSIASVDSAQCATSSYAEPAVEEKGLNTGKSINSYTVPGSKSVNQRQQEMDALHAWLSAEATGRAKGAGISVSLSRNELHSIGDADCPECELLRGDERRLLVGVSKPVGLSADFASLRGRGFAGAFARGVLEPAGDGGFVWTTRISSQGAHALRVVFSGMDLPDDAELYVYNEAGEAFGPYTGRGMNGSGTLVSNTITGDSANVQLRYYGAPRASDLARTRFEIAEVGQIGSRFLLAQRVNATLAAEGDSKAFCSYNSPCIVNGTCNSGWAAHAATRAGVAHMLFQSGSGFYICSGGLLGNTANSNRPLFLTANHCISTTQEAGSLETFWDYSSAQCTNGNAPECDYSYATMRTTYETVLGATLLVHGTAGDYSLMDLAAVPEGTPRTFLGFNSSPVATTGGLDLFRVSHPSGAPQSFSRGDVNSTAGTCQTLSRGPFIYSTDNNGATEGGSSGSPVLNTAGQVVGQLYGACGTNLNDECDHASNRTVDGALAHYYPNVDDFLDPQGGGGGVVTHVGNIVLSRVTLNGNRTQGRATVTVRNASNQLVAGATVSGAFTGFYAGNGSAVTNASGVAVINSGTKKGSGTVNFCVNGITGTNMSYNSAANTETCDAL